MHNSMIVFLLNDEARALEVQYERGGPKTLVKTLDPDIRVDDMVVIESGTRWNITTAKVCKVDVDVDFDSTDDVKWVIQSVDMPGFELVQAQEAKAISTVQHAEREKKKAEMRDTLFANHRDEVAKLELSKSSDVIDG